jgi:transposase
LTVPEVRRLLLLMAEPQSSARDHHLRWSLWRRRHQAVARQGHRGRRAQRPLPAQPGPATSGQIPVLDVAGTAELSESAWSQIVALVQPMQPAAPHRGHPSGDLRRQLEGMLALMHSGGPWREVPSAYGPWQTIYTRYALWVRTGLWDQIAAILHPDLLEQLPAAPP